MNKVSQRKKSQYFYSFRLLRHPHIYFCSTQQSAPAGVALMNSAGG